MKFILLSALISISSLASADEIILSSGKIIQCEVRSVTASEISYSERNASPGAFTTVPRESVRKIVYTGGKEVNVPSQESNDAGKVTILPREQEKPAVTDSEEINMEDESFLMRISLIGNQGITSVNIFDNNDNQIADGTGRISQRIIRTSFDPLKTDVFISPELGYFFRKVSVKDYSYNVESSNAGVEGFIPGIVTSPETGEIVSKDSLSSLAYEAEFHSFFLDMKAGANLVTREPGLKLFFNPYVYGSIAELRKSTFTFDYFAGEREFNSSFKFAFFSSFGFGFEVGFYYPSIRTGIQFGYDRRYINRFSIPDNVVFMEVYDDEELNIKRTREIKPAKTDIVADMFTFSVFYCI